MKKLEIALKPKEIKDSKQREIVSKSVMLQEIVEKNFFSSGRFEISNIQLAEITGKEIKKVNRDIKEEFSFIRSVGEEMSHLIIEGGQNGQLLDYGLAMLREDIRETQEPDERNRMRPVIYLSGLALTQIISRWSPLIRFMINTTIHMVQKKLLEKGDRVYSLRSFADELSYLIRLVDGLEIFYTELINDTKIPHIKENYQDTLDQIEELKYEALSNKRKGELAYPALLKITEKIIEVDKQCADAVQKLKKDLTYENKDISQIAYQNE